LQLAFPAFISGVMWATAQSLAFLGSSIVGFVISFPIFSTIPGLIGSLWGILVFKEIKGLRNYLAFGLAALLVSGSVVSVSLSQALGNSTNTTNTTFFAIAGYQYPLNGTQVVTI
jgi:glucose uptake protein GlcU